MRAGDRCRRNAIQRDCPEYVIWVRDILHAGKGPPGYDSGSVDQLGIRDVELVGKKTTRRDPGYSDCGGNEVRKSGEVIGAALRGWIWNVVMVGTCC